MKFSANIRNRKRIIKSTSFFMKLGVMGAVGSFIMLFPTNSFLC